MRGLVLAAAMTLALAAPAFAQDKQTLADIRKDIDKLSQQLQDLRGQLMSSGGSSIQAAGGASALQRMNTMESQLSQLTSATEAMQNRINKVVADGSNQLGDLQFRVCELEKGCDPAKLPEDPLGGKAGSAGASSRAALTAPAPSKLTGPMTGSGAAASAAAGSAKNDMTVNEQAEFDRAKGVLGQGDFQGAADLFAAYAKAYPGGPLTPDAQYMRGQALSQGGDTAGAARAWLDAFSASPTGPRAADNLLALGKALGALGQVSDACTTLSQVSARFPGSQAAGQVGAARASLNCK